MNDLVTVIMSTYNETIDMLDKSIKSVLCQTYSNIQFVIINDNPSRYELHLFLNELSQKHSNVLYIKNSTNLGLVKSLNNGLKVAKGTYIARMDADDICKEDRIQKQLDFMKENNCDFIGSWVIKIDEFDNPIGHILVPKNHNDIAKYQKYGSCLLHPTWFVKKDVFISLNGYRNIFACEDYDFVARALNSGYKTGNVQEALLFYRIRENSISISSEARQKLTMYFINKHKEEIGQISDDDFYNYFVSKEYNDELSKINIYIEKKNNFKVSSNFLERLNILLSLMSNKYLYINIYSKIMGKTRLSFKYLLSCYKNKRKNY